MTETYADSSDQQIVSTLQSESPALDKKEVRTTSLDSRLRQAKHQIKINRPIASTLSPSNDNKTRSGPGAAAKHQSHWKQPKIATFSKGVQVYEDVLKEKYKWKPEKKNRMV